MKPNEEGVRQNILHDVDGIDHQIVIEPEKGWKLFNLKEIWQYRDLFFFLVWRDIKSRYAQSILGVGWAVIQPLFSMVVYTVIFGNLAKMESEGLPYAIFNYSALVPWTYFSNALIMASESLVSSKDMLTKVYFPRVIIPLAPVLGKLVDFGVALLILFGMMLWFGITPTVWALFIPVLVILMMIAASGIGMWVTALAIQYRDIKYGMRFFVQLLMYSVPVVYSIQIVPEHLRMLYALNPMVGVIQGFRSALLGSTAIPWEAMGIGLIVSLLIFITGAFYFKRMERVFADVA